MPISTIRTSHMGSQMGSQKTCISSTSGCLFGTRFCTYFGTVLRSYATSRWLNWILLRRLLQTHLVASKDPKYVAKPRALARVDIYKGDLIGRLTSSPHTPTQEDTPTRRHPTRKARPPRSGTPSQTGRGSPGPYPRTEGPQDPYPTAQAG